MGCGASSEGPAGLKPGGAVAYGDGQETFLERAASMEKEKDAYPLTLLSSVASVAGRQFASPQHVLDGLIAGNKRFMEGHCSYPHRDFKRLAELANEQHPTAAILGCADSRVPPEIAFDQGFGDMFVCRVAGNIATPEEVASLEFAVLELQVKVVLVMGHTSCGAVKAALSGKAFPGFIDTLVDSLDVAVAMADHETGRRLEGGAAGIEAVNEVVKENVKYQVQRCMRSSIIATAVHHSKLLLVGCVYHIDTGKVQILADTLHAGLVLVLGHEGG